MGLEVTGKIIKVLEKQSGTSKKTGKEWETQSFILDNNEQYNNIFCFDLFGTEKIENFNKYNKEGSTVKVDFNVSCREHEGRYYTSLAAWKIFKAEENNSVPPVPPMDAFEPADDINDEDHDDLPF